MSTSLLRLTAACATFALVGCGHVSKDDLGLELAQVRQEMEDGDQSVRSDLGQRIDGVETRVDGVESRMDVVEADLASLTERFDVTIERLEAATRVNTPIYFAFNSSDLQSQYMPLLDDFSTVVKEFYPGALITVEGFTDPAGRAEYNVRLGQQRASAVREYLVSNGGLNSDLVRAVSYGEARPRQVTPGAVREAGQHNRRVVLVVDHRQPSSGSVALATPGS